MSENIAVLNPETNELEIVPAGAIPAGAVKAKRPNRRSQTANLNRPWAKRFQAPGDDYAYYVNPVKQELLNEVRLFVSSKAAQYELEPQVVVDFIREEPVSIPADKAQQLLNDWQGLQFRVLDAGLYAESGGENQEPEILVTPEIVRDYYPPDVVLIFGYIIALSGYGADDEAFFRGLGVGIAPRQTDTATA